MWAAKDEETFRSLILVTKHVHALERDIQFIYGACANDNELTAFVGTWPNLKSNKFQGS